MSALEGEFEWNMVFVAKDPKYKTVSLPDSGECTINTLRSSNKNFNFNGWHAVRLQPAAGGDIQPFKGGEKVRLRVWELPSTPHEIEAGQGSALEPELLVQDLSHYFKKTGSIYFGAPRFVKPGRYRIELEYKGTRTTNRGAVKPVIISYRARDPAYEQQISELMARITQQEASAAAGFAEARRLGGGAEAAAARAAAQADSSLHKELLARLTTGAVLNKKLQAKLARDAARRAGVASAAGASASQLSKVQLEVLNSMHLPRDPPAEIAKAAAERIGCDVHSVQLALESDETRDQRLAEERARRLLSKLAERKEAEAALVTAAAKRKPAEPAHLVERSGVKAVQRAWSKRHAAMTAWQKQQHSIEDGQLKVIQPGPGGRGKADAPVGLVLSTRKQVPLLRKPTKPNRQRLRRQRFENLCAGESAVIWCAQLAPSDVTNMILSSRTFQIAHDKQLEMAAAAAAAAEAAAEESSTPPGSEMEGGDAKEGGANDGIRRSRRGRHVKVDGVMTVTRGPVTAKDTLGAMKAFLHPNGQIKWNRLAGQVGPPVTGHKPAEDSDSDDDGGFASPMRSPGAQHSGTPAARTALARGCIGAAAIPVKGGGASSRKRPRQESSSTGAELPDSPSSSKGAAVAAAAPHVAGSSAPKTARRELASAEPPQAVQKESASDVAALQAARCVQHHLSPEQHLSPQEYAATVASSLQQ